MPDLKRIPNESPTREHGAAIRDRVCKDLATKRCGTCGGSWWGVNWRGDSWSEPSRRNRVTEQGGK